MDRRLLQPICAIGKIPGEKTADEVENADVKKWFDESLYKKPKEITEGVHSAIDDFKFELEKSDSSGSAFMSIVNIDTALEDNIVSEVLQYTEKSIYDMKLLEKKIELTILRTIVHRKSLTLTKEEKSSIVKFQETISEAAADFQEH